MEVHKIIIDLCQAKVYESNSDRKGMFHNLVNAKRALEELMQEQIDNVLNENAQSENETVATVEQ